MVKITGRHPLEVARRIHELQNVNKQSIPKYSPQKVEASQGDSITSMNNLTEQNSIISSLSRTSLSSAGTKSKKRERFKELKNQSS